MTWKEHGIAALLIAACLLVAVWRVDPVSAESPGPANSTVRFRLRAAGAPPLVASVWADFEVPVDVFVAEGGDQYRWLALSRRELGGPAGARTGDHRDAQERVRVLLDLRRRDVGILALQRQAFEQRHRPFPPSGVRYDPITPGKFDAYWFAADDGEEVSVSWISNMVTERRIAPYVFAQAVFSPLPPDGAKALDARLADWLRLHLMCVRVRQTPKAVLEVAYDGSAHRNAGCAAVRKAPR